MEKFVIECVINYRWRVSFVWISNSQILQIFASVSFQDLK